MSEDGAVALEVVLVVPLVAVLLLAVLGTTVVASDQLAAARAARAAARAVALTGDPHRADAAAASVAPTAVVTTRLRGGVVEVEVHVAGDVLGVGYAVTASAAAPLEPVAVVRVVTVVRWWRGRSEAGAVGVHVVLLAAVAATVVVTVTAAAGSVVVAEGRAQDAADAAALAAARAAIEAASPRAAATTAAATHGGTLVGCVCAGHPVRVTVVVPVTAPAARALGVTERRASASATLLHRGSAPGRTLGARSSGLRERPADMIVGTHSATTRPR